jgi:hypothetical protein
MYEVAGKGVFGAVIYVIAVSVDVDLAFWAEG